MPAQPGQACLGLVAAGKDHHLRLQPQVGKPAIQAAEPGLPFVMNQETPPVEGPVAFFALPGAQLQQTLINIEACRIRPRADYDYFAVRCNLQISLFTSSILATIGA
jgi:hypothetical protein